MEKAAFLTVGIGASAGGIPAVKRFFEQVPADSGIAYVVVLHLSPEHDSHLAEVLQSSATIPVTTVRDRERVQPDHVYVIPPNKSLSMRDGCLSLSAISGFEERRAPVDVFFRTLAESHGSRAISIVLSGTGANGSMGMRRIKEEGGLCLVQDPDEAEYGDMPRNAIARALVDHVLPVAAMPAKIAAYAKALGSIRLPEAGDATTPASDDAALHEIFTLIRAQTGHDFSNYKRNTILRRLARRMSLHAIPDLAGYVTFLQSHRGEVVALLKDLLISVTSFFRDREAFEILARDVIPALFAGKGEADHVRVWVAGCATGEEVYSIAMLLAEQMPAGPGAATVQIFATDIDESAIAVAREGLYTLNDAADVPPERLERFFTKEGDAYRVRKELREMVLFARHNPIKDPPFSHLDLVSCRNFLIYLNRSAQRRVLDVMHFALRTGGYLFLGSAESVEGSADLFSTANKDAYLFQRRDVMTRFTLPVPESTLAGYAPTGRGREREQEQEQEQEVERRAHERRSTVELHQRLLEEYAPPSVVVNEEYDIIHLSDRAGRYLEFPGGEPSRNLLKVIRPELRIELRTALYQAAEQRSTVEAPNLLARTGDGAAVGLTLVVRPIVRRDDPARGFFLVLFQEGESGDITPAETANRLEPGDGIRQLEGEVGRLKNRLRATVERHEAQAEELRASNEELQAMNEELRSSAEELETSKEELQSLNEELRTVNQELKTKIDELSHINNDMRNLMAATEIGTIFLDRTLSVKLFTPRARDAFNLVTADIGRPLQDIANKLAYEGLLDDAKIVIDSLQTVEREVDAADGRFFLVRLLPYRTAEDRIDGVVVTFVDITDRRRAELELRKLKDRLADDLSTMTRLHEVSTRLLTIQTFPDLLDEILSSLIELQRAEFGNIQLYDQRSGRLEIASQRGFSRNFVAHFDNVADASSACGRAARTGKRVVIEDVQQDPAYAPHREIAAAAGYRAVQSTPLFSRGGKLLGVLSTHFRQPHRLSERDLRLTDLYSWQAARMIEAKQAEEAVRVGEARLRLIVDSVPDYAILSLSTDGRIVTWNHAAERVFGYQEPEIIGQSVEVLFTPEDRAGGVPEQEIQRARELGQAVDERWHLTRQGERFFASGVIAPLLNDDGVPVGYVKIARDLTDRKRWEDALKQAHADLETRVQERTAELAAANKSLDAELRERREAEGRIRGLVGRLISAQEDERRRVARDLHDHLGQQVAGLSLKIDGLVEVSRRNRALRAAVEDIQQTIGRLDRELDFFTWQMRPPALEEAGLPAALGKFVDQWGKNFGVAVEFHSHGLDKVRFPFELESNLYRITQEALNNVHKHSQASRVGIILERREPDLALIIEDNGVGFDRDQPHGKAANRGVGLLGMQERIESVGGTLEVETGPTKGTTIFVRVPLARP